MTYTDKLLCCQQIMAQWPKINRWLNKARKSNIVFYDEKFIDIFYVDENWQLRTLSDKMFAIIPDEELQTVWHLLKSQDQTLSFLLDNLPQLLAELPAAIVKIRKTRAFLVKNFAAVDNLAAVVGSSFDECALLKNQ